MNFKKIKLCKKSLPFASLAECGLNSDMLKKPFETACEEIVFKFESDFKSNMKIILAREDVVFMLPSATNYWVFSTSNFTLFNLNFEQQNI